MSFMILDLVSLGWAGASEAANISIGIYFTFFLYPSDIFLSFGMLFFSFFLAPTPYVPDSFESLKWEDQFNLGFQTD